MKLAYRVVHNILWDIKHEVTKLFAHKTGNVRKSSETNDNGRKTLGFITVPSRNIFVVRKKKEKEGGEQSKENLSMVVEMFLVWTNFVASRY